MWFEGSKEVELAATTLSQKPRPLTVSQSPSHFASVHILKSPKFYRSRPTRGMKGLNGRLAFAIAAAALSSAFQHGYNTGVINAPEKLIEKWLVGVLSERANVTSTDIPESQVIIIWSIAVSIFCVGGMIGGALTFLIADRLGRKKGLLYNNILVFAAALLQGLAKSCNSYEMIILGRFLIGINSGLNAGLVPMYLAEISPKSLRGAIGTVYQLVITISILLSQIFGLENLLGTENGWPLLFAITAVPAIFQLVVLPLCPESPNHLLIREGNELAAQRALTWLRGSLEVHEEMDTMRHEYESSKLQSRMSLREMITNPIVRIPLLIAITVMISQQFSGINAVMFFSTRVFNSANLSYHTSQLATLGMGSVNVLMTVVSLLLVEKAGRKTLLLIGFIGMLFVTILLTICLNYVKLATWVPYASIVLVLLFVIMFAIGPGSIPWFLVNELFNPSARPAAASAAVAVNWTANFFVGIGFLPLQKIMGPNVFIIFIVFLVLFSLFVWRKVPETKNKSYDEIQTMFRQRSYQ